MIPYFHGACSDVRATWRTHPCQTAGPAGGYGQSILSNILLADVLTSGVAGVVLREVVDVDEDTGLVLTH